MRKPSRWFIGWPPILPWRDVAPSSGSPWGQREVIARTLVRPARGRGRWGNGGLCSDRTPAPVPVFALPHLPRPPLRVPHPPFAGPRNPPRDPTGAVGVCLSRRVLLALILPVGILAPARSQILPAPNRPDQFPQRALGPPDPESVEQGAALPVEPFAACPPAACPPAACAAQLIPSAPCFRAASTRASAGSRLAPKVVPRPAAKPSCRSAPRCPDLSPAQAASLLRR